MKCTIPEISWHNRDPVLSIDVQPSLPGESFERLATGGTDTHVLIWHIEVSDSGAVRIEFVADLQRHQKAVNVVRFSPSGEYLASGDDESAIIIWKQKTDQDAPELPTLGDNDVQTKEQWIGVRVLRGHVDDVYDLSWSPDSASLISGSVDNTAIIWDIQKGRNMGMLKDHKGFVQGVTWDPKNQFVATLGSDRTCRVFNVNNKKLVSRVSKSQLPVPETSEYHKKTVRLFHDDTLKSFFRRLCFSPDGELLIAPSGIIENPDSDKNNNATHIFTRYMLNKPAAYLPTNSQYTVAVRCCPLLFVLHEREPLFALPYRMVIAVATQNSVLLYDTQQAEPFGIVSNIHYTRLTDLSWSSDGRLLVVSSTDGYCSIITFQEGELGERYKPKDNTSQPVESKTVADNLKSLSLSAPSRVTEVKQEGEAMECTVQSQNDNKTVDKSDDRGGTCHEQQSKDEVSETKTEKAPRRITPIFLSPAQKQAKVSQNTKSPRRIQPVMISKQSKLSKCPETTNSGDSKCPETANSGYSKSPETTNSGDSKCPETTNSRDSKCPETANSGDSKSPETTNSGDSKCPETTNSGDSKCPETTNSGDVDSERCKQVVKPAEMSAPVDEEDVQAQCKSVSVSPISERTPRRVQLITLSNPKAKKQL